jgi:hypothetical protein
MLVPRRNAPASFLRFSLARDRYKYDYENPGATRRPFETIETWLDDYSCLSGTNSPASTTSIELETMCRTLLGHEDEMYYADTVSWIGLLDKISAIGLRLQLHDMFREAAELLSNAFSHDWIDLEDDDDDNYQVYTVTAFIDSIIQDGFKNKWEELSWWISMQGSLSTRTGMCDLLIQAWDCAFDDPTLDNPANAKFRSVDALFPRLAPILRSRRCEIDWLAWKKARILDAINQIQKPHPGDALRLVKLAPGLQDNHLLYCAVPFIGPALCSAHNLLFALETFLKERDSMGDRTVLQYCGEILYEATKVDSGLLKKLRPSYVWVSSLVKPFTCASSLCLHMLTTISCGSSTSYLEP